MELQEHRSRQGTDGVGAHSSIPVAAQDGLMREAEVLFLEAKEHPKSARLFFRCIFVVVIDIFAFSLLL